jgi:FaeA-like protein
LRESNDGAIDTQHSVSDALGNRFLLSRLEPGKGQLRWSLRHVGGKTAAMRHELAESVNLLFAVPRPDPQELCEHEIERFERVTELVVRLRGAVERDRYRRQLDAVYGAEGPARLGLSLERLLAGLDVLGVERKTALDVVISVALDSTPSQRRSIYRFLCQPLNPLNPPPPNAATLATWNTKEVAEAMGLPSITVRRGLEELTSYGLASCYPGKQGVVTLWQGIVLP